MKHLIYFILSLFIITFCSCHNRTKAEMPATFTNAISYINTNPAKTAEYLKLMAPDTINMKRVNYLCYWLYRTYAESEAGITKIPFHRAEVLENAFGRASVPDSLRMLATYLKAGAFRDSGDLPQAAELYLAIIKYGKKHHFLLDPLMARCYKQLAKCYEGVSLYQSAIEVLTEATQIVKGQQLADMYESCADCYKLLQQYDSAAMLMQKACNVPHLPEEKRNELMIERVTFDVALNHKKDVINCKDALFAINEQQMPTSKLPNIHEAKALYFENIGRSDSANTYWQQVLAKGSLPMRQRAAKHLLILSVKQSNSELVKRYANSFKQLTDSVMHTAEAQRMQQVNNAYDYQLQQRKMIETERQSNNKLLISLLVCGSLLIIVVVMTIWMIQRERKHAIDMFSKQTEIDTMSQAAGKLQLELQQLHDEDFKKAVENMPKLKQMLLDVEGEMPTQLWGMLCKIVDAIYPQLSVNIGKKLPDISDKQQKIVYLLCIGIPNKNIAILLNTTPQNVFGYKKRINLRLSKREALTTLEEKELYYKLRGKMAE